MAYDIRLMKLVTGELIIGKFDAEKDCLNEVATLQTVPTQQGVQMMLLPYGYPFEPDFTGSIEGKNFLYRYANTPQELQDKYIEACTNLTVAGGLGRMQFSSEPFGGSGTTILAAQKTGRQARAIELAPQYTDVAVKRFQQNHPDIPVTLLATGQTFAEVEAERLETTHATE